MEPMKDRCLVIETPRAGDLGHRFLVSCPGLSESEIVGLVTESTRTPIGSHYISTSQQVAQTLNTKTVRFGVERIILYGIDTNGLTPEKLALVQNELQVLFGPVENLIKTMDWQRNARSVVVVLPELQRWIEKSIFSDLLPTDSSNPISAPLPRGASAGHQKRNRSSIFWFFLCLGLLAILAFFSVIFTWPPPPGTPRGSSQSPLSQNTKVNDIEQLAREWKCNQEDLGKSLLRAANWDRRNDKLHLNAIKNDQEVKKLVAQIIAAKKESPTRGSLVSPSLRNEDNFRDWVIDQNIKTPAQARVLREQLFTAYKHLKDLEIACERVDDDISDTKVHDPFTKYIIEIAKNDPSERSSDDFVEPKTPLFDRQDAIVYDLLQRTSRSLIDSGVVERGRVALSDSRDDLRITVSYLKAVTNMQSKIKKSREDVNDKIDHSAFENVRSAYEQLEIFLDKFSKLGDE
jgi:hypothetical protein